MMQPITTAFLLLFAISTLLRPVMAEDVDLSISTQAHGLTLEFPLTTLNSTYTTSTDVLETIHFGGSSNLVISEKKGLTDDNSEQEVSMAHAILPSPVISPVNPPLEATSLAAVVIAEPTAKFILDSFPTPTPTYTPTPTPAQVAAAQANINVQLSNGGLNADILFEMSNSYRQSQGLPSFTKDARACELAAARAPEIGAEIANGNMHAGMYGRGLPYWNTENIISMASEQAAFDWWINDGIHHAAIVGSYAYSCVACSGNNCAQEFTNFQPK